MNVQLRTLAVPAQAPTADQPRIPTEEYMRACDALYAAAASDWVVVYGDREHAANLSYLCGFDPRFEEALLVLGRDARRTLIVGNEGMGYASVAPIELEIALAQSLSLMGQTRVRAPRLAAVLHAIGIAEGHQVAVVGWKYLEPEETDDPTAPAFVPAMLVDILRRLVGQSGRVVDVTSLLLHPSTGLKVRNSAARIAAAEWSAMRAGEAVRRKTHLLNIYALLLLLCVNHIRKPAGQASIESLMWQVDLRAPPAAPPTSLEIDHELKQFWECLGAAPLVGSAP